jgi:hypothetical protein
MAAGLLGSPVSLRFSDAVYETPQPGPSCVARGCRQVKVRLTKKLAECIDGVDLANRRVGEVLDLSVEDARLLLAEAWAEPLKPQDPETAEPAQSDSLAGERPVVISVQLGPEKNSS